MKIKRYKNAFCLCAVSGCHHLANIALQVRMPYKDKKIIIFTCIDCAFDLSESNDIYF